MTTETITWRDAARSKPEGDATVLVRCTGTWEPVWLGWFDGEQWFDTEATPVEVTHWAEMPKGPTPSADPGEVRMSFDEQPDDDSFDEVIRRYAQACTHGDKAGMREGYVKLRAMCGAAPVAHAPVPVVAWNEEKRRIDVSVAAPAPSLACPYTKGEPEGGFFDPDSDRFTYLVPLQRAGETVFHVPKAEADAVLALLVERGNG
jgi:hypothetical protein